MNRNALVTGGAGFIGSHLVDRLLAEGWRVTTVDCFDDFYDPAVKRRNVRDHGDYSTYTLVEADLRDGETLAARLPGDYDVVVHLAARAGVRPSIQDPLLYQEVNVRGTHTLLELCRRWKTPQVVYASSSSVYGVNPNVPWKENECDLLPISPYASTKLSGEFLGHVYSRLFGLRFVGLRFFTVYGPRQRPDLAIHKFSRLMLAGERIPYFGDGQARRDYTYVADTVSGIVAAMDYTATPFEIINLGNDSAVSLAQLVGALEDVLGVNAELQRLPDQPGDVPQTWASLEKARRLLGYAPSTTLHDGLRSFASWLASTMRAEAATYAMSTAPRVGELRP